MSRGLALLRVAPLITTTCSLTFQTFSHLLMLPFAYMPDNLRAQANVILSAHMNYWVPPALFYIAAIYPSSWALAIANISVKSDGVDLHGDETAKAAWAFYFVGLMFSVGHYFWGYYAKNLLDKIMAWKLNEDEAQSGEKDSVAMLKDQWLPMNRNRAFIVDLPGWICFLVAFLLSSE